MKIMKTFYYKKNAKRILTLATSIFLIATVFSCNKDFENKLQPSSENDTLGIDARSRKVLYIIIDGVRGEALKSINAPNISKMAKNSIYAYNSLSDFGGNSITNAGAWSDMLTGVRAGKHMVNAEDFSGSKLSQYPSVFTRLKQARDKIRTVAIGASPEFVTNLAVDATERKTYENDDAAVKKAGTEELKNKDATFIVLQFHGVEKSGQQNGYSEITPSYANAILQVDAYVGDILYALKERPDFSKENWLIIVASNKGGDLPPDPTNTDVTAYGDHTRNNFVVFYNPRFSTLYIPKPASDKIPYNGTTPVFYGDDAENRKAIVANDGGLYNFGMNDFSVQFKFKTNGNDAYYPIFLSKKEGLNNPNPGWLFYIAANHYSMNVCGNGGYINVNSNGPLNSVDGQWHTITAIFYMDGVKRFVKCFTDGVLTLTPQDITARGSLDSNVPLQLGQNPGSPEVMIKELQIYNVALPDAHVDAYYRKTTVAKTQPYYDNLVGYWPADEGKGNIIVNQSPVVAAKDKNFILTGAYQWQSFSDYSPLLEPPLSDDFYKVVPNNVDIPFEIYQWMGISVPLAWGLDGKSWNPVYSDLKP